MLWALAIMGFKLALLLNERKLLDANLISIAEGMRILPEDTREFERQIEILSEKQKVMVLPRAILNALRRFSTPKIYKMFRLALIRYLSLKRRNWNLSFQ